MPKKENPARNVSQSVFEKYIAKAEKRNGMTQETAKEIVSGVFQYLSEMITSGDIDSITILDFGRFYISQQPERRLVNIGTKEIIVTPPCSVLRFRPSEGLKCRIKECPQTRSEE